MTGKEARQMLKWTIVMWDDDPSDTGTITALGHPVFLSPGPMGIMGGLITRMLREYLYINPRR